MRRLAFIASMILAGGLAAAAQSAMAEDVNPQADTPEARSRCLGLSYEISMMMDQVETEQNTAIKEAGANPTYEQTQNIKALESDYVGLAYMWADLADYFADADAPNDDVNLDLALLTDEEFSKELDICDGLIEGMESTKVETFLTGQRYRFWRAHICGEFFLTRPERTSPPPRSKLQLQTPAMLAGRFITCSGHALNDKG